MVGDARRSHCQWRAGYSYRSSIILLLPYNVKYFEELLFVCLSAVDCCALLPVVQQAVQQQTAAVVRSVVGKLLTF